MSTTKVLGKAMHLALRFRTYQKIYRTLESTFGVLIGRCCSTLDAVRGVRDEDICPIITKQDIPRERTEVVIYLVVCRGEIILPILIPGNLGMKWRGERLEGDTV